MQTLPSKALETINQANERATRIKTRFTNVAVQPLSALTLALHTIIRNESTCRAAFNRGTTRLINQLIEFSVSEMPILLDQCITTPTNCKFDGLHVKHVSLAGEPIADDQSINAPIKLFAVTIMRAGDAYEIPLRAVLGDGMRVGKMLIQRSEATSSSEHSSNRVEVTARMIWGKLPVIDRSSPPCVLLCDIMLATGSSIIVAIEYLLEIGVPLQSIILLVLLGVEEGIERITSKWPTLKICIGFIDEGLSNEKYILPGLGDAGDRFYL